ncbi:hypothetical protein FHG87_013178 [Trinorchestia longiramus]|nr:hypothetical protein FHG87_013178 [Trinorchestia longiramus]
MNTSCFSFHAVSSHLSLIRRGEQYLVVTVGSPADTEKSCHAISFHKEQTYSFSYRDSRGDKKILSGTYYVNFPTLTSTGSIVINDLPDEVLGDGGSDSELMTLYPIGYSNGITMFVTCRSYYFSFERRFFIFLDDEANLNWVNPHVLSTFMNNAIHPVTSMNQKQQSSSRMVLHVVLMTSLVNEFIRCAYASTRGYHRKLYF